MAEKADLVRILDIRDKLEERFVNSAYLIANPGLSTTSDEVIARVANLALIVGRLDGTFRRLNNERRGRMGTEMAKAPARAASDDF